MSKIRKSNPDSLLNVWKVDHRKFKFKYKISSNFILEKGRPKKKLSALS